MSPCGHAPNSIPISIPMSMTKRRPAGLARATLYYHFASKEEIAVAIASYDRDAALLALKEHIERQSPAIDLLSVKTGGKPGSNLKQLYSADSARTGSAWVCSWSCRSFSSSISIQ